MVRPCMSPFDSGHHQLVRPLLVRPGQQRWRLLTPHPRHRTRSPARPPPHLRHRHAQTPAAPTAWPRTSTAAAKAAAAKACARQVSKLLLLLLLGLLGIPAALPGRGGAVAG
jgi:hypothetical protein